MPFQNSKSTRTAGRVGCQHSLRHPLGRSSDQTPAGAKQQDEGYCISAASKDFWILQIRRRLVHSSLLGVWTPGQRKMASPDFHSYITTFFYIFYPPLRGRDNSMPLPECELQPGGSGGSVQFSQRPQPLTDAMGTKADRPSVRGQSMMEWLP